MPRIGEELENRCLRFAVDVRVYLKALPKSPYEIDDARQLSRSSASVGANYIEGNEGFSRKDFLMRVRISIKEARESQFWLRLIADDGAVKQRLLQECSELIRIFGAILRNAQRTP